MNPVEQRDYHAFLAERLKEADDEALLDSRRTLNAELRSRGFCTDQDSAEGVFPIVAGFILGLGVGLVFAYPVIYGLFGVVS